MKATSVGVNFLRTPILFIVFNRPDTTIKVFEAIRKVKPSRLYIASDGPRDEKNGEDQRVMQVRKIVTAIDWPCELKTLFREKNLGCKYGISNGIDWFFKHEEQGIILEDDCLPHQDFFQYCQALLNYYRNSNKVLAISGVNFYNKNKSDYESYYFSKYFHCWGWATWRSSWDLYDREISFWPLWKCSEDWNRRFTDKVEKKYWEKIFDLTYSKQIDTWDYQFLASLWKKNGLTVIPKKNLVTNIGFGNNASHTTDVTHKFSNFPLKEIGKLIHPKKIKQNHKRDRDLFDLLFEGRYLRVPWIFFSFPRRKVGYLLRKIKFILKFLIRS